MDDTVFAGYIDVDDIIVLNINTDTLWPYSGDESDTMVAMAQFKVYGELIADSIQAVGDVIELDDNIDVHGSADIDDSLTVTNNVHIGGDLYVGGTIDADLNQSLAQEHVDTIAEFGTSAVPVIAMTFASSGDSLQITATVVVSDEYSVTPNYNGAKIRVEIYDVTAAAVLKNYTVFLRDDDWYETKEVSLVHIVASPAASNDYEVRCYADGWGDGGRFIEGDLTILAIQN